MVINNGIKSGFLHMKTVDIEHGGSDIYRRSRFRRGGCKLRGVRFVNAQSLKCSSYLMPFGRFLIYTTLFNRYLLRDNHITMLLLNRFFASMKQEVLYRKDCRSKAELLSTVKEYVRFYNNERPHTALGYKTPVQFEDQYFQRLSEE